MRRTAKIIGDLLGELRKPGEIISSANPLDLSLTQGKLAETLGVSRMTINDLVLGKRGIGPGVALKLERVFGLKAEDIVIASALDALDRERDKRT